MRVPRPGFLVFSLLALGACSSGTDPVAPAAPTEQLPTEAELSRGQLVSISAIGAGVIDLSSAGVGDSKLFVAAIATASGKAYGFFSQRRETPSGLVDFSGIVTCLTVNADFPGRARIGGIVTANRSTHPSFMTDNHEVGDDVWFRVEDGGGLGATDLSTTLGFKPTLVNTSAEYCALPFTGLPWWNPASIFPLKSGLIDVRS